MDPQSNMKAQRLADAYRLARLQAQDHETTAAAQRLANSVPFLPELGAAWSAGLRSADDLSSRRPVDFGGRWDEARAQQRGYADEFQREHPVAGNMLGALGMASPAAIGSTVLASRGAAQAAAPLVRSTSPATAALVPRMRQVAGSFGQNATSGALAGAAYGLSRPGTLDQRAQYARNAFVAGAAGGALGPLALGGLGKAAAGLARAPGAVAAIRRSLAGAPLTRTLGDLGASAGVDLEAALGRTGPLAQSLQANHEGSWSEVNEMAAPVTTNDVLESPQVIHKFGSVMNDIEDEGREPLRQIPVANDYYSPIFGNLIPDFSLQLPTVEAVDTTRRQLLEDVWRRYGGSGRLELDPEGESVLGKAKALGDLLSDGPDLAGRAYRQAFGGSGDQLSLRGAFQSAQGKLFDPQLDPDDYAGWLGGLRPFEQHAARAAAANDVLQAVNAGRSDVFASPLVQRRMQAAFGPETAADLVGKLRLENIASSLGLPGAAGAGAQAGGPMLDPRNPVDFGATRSYDTGMQAPASQPNPGMAFLPPPLAVWRGQQDDNRR